jgi:DNA ligase 1
VKAFAALYRRLDSETSTRAKQAAMVEFFAAAKADPLRWASAAWTVYFLAGGKPRQTAPTRLLWRLAVEGSGYPDWLCAECYGAVGDLAEMLSLILPEGAGGEEVALDVWMRERLLPLPSLGEEERYARLKQWVGELPADERLAFFKLITGELRVGVSRLQAVKALAEVAGVDEGRMAQRLIGYSQARRIPTAADFEALIGEVLHAEAEALDAGKPYPFYLAQSWSRPLGEMFPALGSPAEWIVEWKFDGIRAQLLKRGENWRLWSRGEELISDAYPDLEPLARALPSGAALDGELVVLIPPAGDYPWTRSTASPCSRACSRDSAARSSAKRRCVNCPSPSSPTTCSRARAETSGPSRSTSGGLCLRSSSIACSRNRKRGASACRSVSARPFQPTHGRGSRRSASRRGRFCARG